jgi:hypothetical protein
MAVGFMSEVGLQWDGKWWTSFSERIEIVENIGYRCTMVERSCHCAGAPFLGIAGSGDKNLPLIQCGGASWKHCIRNQKSPSSFKNTKRCLKSLYTANQNKNIIAMP